MPSRLPRRLAALAAFVAATPAFAADIPIPLNPSMITNESGVGKPEGMVDEQAYEGAYKDLVPATPWDVKGLKPAQFPVHAYIDLGAEKHLSRISFYDMNGTGDLIVSIGEPGQWQEVLTDGGKSYKRWNEHPLEVTTRYLRLSKQASQSGFHEVLLWEQSPEDRAAALAKKEAMEKAQAEKANRPVVDAGAMFGELSLIQEIDLGQPSDDVELLESKPGISKVETVLGQPMRVLEPTAEAAYFAVRLGKHKLLEAGKWYVLTLEFPDDVARSFSISNRGGETSRGVRTGHAVGDVFFTYTNNNLESVNVPLTGKVQTWRQMFMLSDRTAGLEVPRGPGARPDDPDDGFLVIISVPNKQNMLGSAGAAVGKVRLFEAPNPQQFDAKLALPPDGLPRRHVFVREEMGDSVLGGKKPEEGAYNDSFDFYRYKLRNHRLLAMNTYAKDLLEFGSTQGWDTGGNEWYFTSAQGHLWEKIVKLAGEEGLEVLPYYEYAGSRGNAGLGHQRRAQPLSGGDAYTHITWAEKSRADLTDPDTLTDIKRLMDMTILRYKDDAKFVGAWIRPRMAQLPISFADATRERFAKAANGGTAVTREQLKNDKELLQKYYDWWFEQRRDFLVAIRDHLRSNGVEDANVLFTSQSGEPGPSLRKKGVTTLVTDQPSQWEEWLRSDAAYEKYQAFPLDQAIAENWYGEAATAWPGTWGSWEWQHATPPADPQHYADVPGVMMTFPFNRVYTVSNGEAFAPFRNETGLAAVKFYPLNENTRDKLIGYYVADYDHAGPYSMLAEALAVAHGDPTYLGYLSGYNHTTGFPEYVRDFNLNYLALPALPSQILDASSEPSVVVRVIDAGAHGTYYAVVNTGLQPVDKVVLALPGDVRDAVTGEPAPREAGKVTLSLHPAQLKSLHVKR